MRWIFSMLSAAAVFGSGPLVAADPPAPQAQFELGTGAIALKLPDYRGSDRYGTRFYPVPYAAYRTERVQVGREGVRARLFATERLSASLSAAAVLPGNNDNPDRAGMPQIDPTFEAGPSLDWMLHDGDGGRLRVRAKLPVRSAMAADGLEFKSIGWVAVPHLRVDYGERRADIDSFYAATLGPVWSSEDYHEYFYGVAAPYADPALNRPAFDARGGYGGMRLSASGTLRRGAWRLGVFGSCDWLDGAAFEDSPLVKTERSLVSGIFVSYVLIEAGISPPLEGEAP